MQKNGFKIKKPVTRGIVRVPVIIQLETLECGAASLAMVMAYYDKWVPIEKVRSDCGVSRDGSNALNIIKASRTYGFTAKGYKYEPEELQAKGSFPCIIHWNFNHFVVLCGFKNGKAMINDPANGRYMVSMQTFDESFTGICLMFSPNEQFVPSGKPKSILSFAKDRLRGTGEAIAFVAITGIISSLLGIISPAFSRIFLDRLLTGQDPDWIKPFLFALTAFSILQLSVAWIQSIYSLKLNGKMDAIGSSSFFWKILHLPMDFFSQRMAGDLQQRQEDNSTISGTIVNTVAPLALNIMMLFFYLIVMLRYSLILSLIGIGSLIINGVAARIISAQRVNITRVQMRDAGKLSSATVAGIEMIETIKASGAENGYFEHWSGYQANLNTRQVHYAKISEYLGIIPAIASSIADTLIMLVGLWLTMRGEFTIGMIMAFQGILASFLEPAETIISAGQTIQEMRTQMERIDDVMNYPDDDVNAASITEDEDYSKLHGDIEIKDLTFGYSKLADPLIKDFNLKIKAGSRIAIVGSTGCGKSTLSRLLSGLYKPWTGEILFDGRPMKKIDRNTFTASLAIVDQDIILFEDTIANNIKMWDSSIEDFEMILAARDAQIHADIMERDGGYNYKLLEGGRDMSGGQRQRIEIARVLAQDPTIIILDEATSALDAKTENEIVNAISDRGITCIVIAHRLSTIRDCDNIIVLDHGQIAEQGTHKELYAMNGLYTSLVEND